MPGRERARAEGESEVVQAEVRRGRRKKKQWCLNPMGNTVVRNQVYPYRTNPYHPLPTDSVSPSSRARAEYNVQRMKPLSTMTWSPSRNRIGRLKTEDLDWKAGRSVGCLEHVVDQTPCPKDGVCGGG